MRTIWKYQLHVVDEIQEKNIPGYGGVAHVADQDGFANMVTIWCHVDTEGLEYNVRFRVTGTGHPAPDKEFVFCGSALCGDFVWHVWAG